jgi:hypothetical protein
MAAFKKTKKKVIRTQEQETNIVLNENYEVGALLEQSGLRRQRPN